MLYTDIAYTPIRINRTKAHSSCVRVQTKSFVLRKCSNDNNGSIGTGCRLFQAGIKIHECWWSCWWSLWNCSTNSGRDHRDADDLKWQRPGSVLTGMKSSGRVLLFVVLQTSNTGISCIVDCATFKFNFSQIVETVEFVMHFLWNTGLFSVTWNESGCSLHDRLKIYNVWSTVPYFVCTAPGKSHET